MIFFNKTSSGRVCCLHSLLIVKDLNLKRGSTCRTDARIYASHILYGAI